MSKVLKTTGEVLGRNHRNVRYCHACWLDCHRYVHNLFLCTNTQTITFFKMEFDKIKIATIWKKNPPI